MNQSNGGDILFHFKGDSKQLQSTMSKMGSMTKSILVATGITKALSTGWNMVTSSMDGAISRIDTLNNFPRVMDNLGVSADDSRKAIDKMSKKLQGLPTTLDAGAMAVQRFTSANGDIAKSTDMFLALNNAILAGGASTEIQSSALEQLSQAYAKGKPDMMEWRTMMTAMPAQLKQVAKYMGYGENGASALGEALREGSVSMDDFMEAIMVLNTQGAEGIKAFEEQAKGATGGIRTSITNMKTAVTRGVGNIVSSLNEGLKNAGFDGISGLISNFGSNFEKGLTQIGKFIEPMLTDLLSGNISVGEATEKITAKLMEILEKGIGILTEQIPVVVPQIIDGIAGVINGVANALPTLIPKVVDMLYNFMEVITSNETLDTIIDVTTNLAVKIVEGLVNALANLLSDPKKLFKVMQVAILGLPGLIFKRLAERFGAVAVPFIADMISKAVSIIGDVVNGIKQTISDTVGSFVASIIEKGKAIIGTFVNIITHPLESLGFAIGFIAGKIARAVLNIVTFVQSLPGKIRETLTTIITNVVTWFSETKQKITQRVTEIIEGVISTITSLPGRMKKKGEETARSIGEGIISFKEWIKNKVVSIANTIVETIKSLPGKMLKLGENIIRGLWNGIINFKDWIIGKIRGFANSVVEGFKKGFGIGSPSKLMADEIGKWIPKGISVGIMANADSITKTMQDIEDLTLGAFGGQFTNAPHFSPSVIVNSNVNVETDPLGQTVSQIKTFAGGAKNDYNYGMGV